MKLYFWLRRWCFHLLIPKSFETPCQRIHRWWFLRREIFSRNRISCTATKSDFRIALYLQLLSINLLELHSWPDFPIFNTHKIKLWLLVRFFSVRGNHIIDHVGHFYGLYLFSLVWQFFALYHKILHRWFFLGDLEIPTRCPFPTGYVLFFLDF